MTQTPKYAQKYKAKGNCLYEIVPGKSGTVERKLCNLVPEILCEITVDDGAVTTTYVRLRGVHESGRILPEIEIPAAELASFNWMPERWGMDCILEVGKTVKDCVRHAIQTTAAYAEKKTAYQVTGWRKIGADWHYLMPGDAEQTVILPGKLQGYVDVPEMAWDFMEFATRPTTIIYPNARNLAPSLIAEDGTVGIRVTSDPFCIRLCQALHRPIVSTSANISGQPSAAFFNEISQEIIDNVDYVVKYRQKDKTKSAPSVIIKLTMKNEIQIIRK